jgi:hypothetical protein
MEMRHITVRRRKRRTLKGTWGALAWTSFLLVLGIGGGVERDTIALGAGFLMMAASMCAAALFAWLAGWME